MAEVSVSCFRTYLDYEFEIIVFEDERKKDFYDVAIQPNWDCDADMQDFPGSYSGNLSIDEANDWLNDFWDCGEADSIIDGCQRAEYDYLQQLYSEDGYKGAKVHKYSYLEVHKRSRDYDTEVLVFEITVTLKNGRSKTFVGKDNHDDGNYAEIRALEKAWEWVESGVNDM
jgi:hypothetical protein